MKVIRSAREAGIIIAGRPFGWFNHGDRLHSRGLVLWPFILETDDRGRWSFTFNRRRAA